MKPARLCGVIRVRIPFRHPIRPFRFRRTGQDLRRNSPANPACIAFSGICITLRFPAYSPNIQSRPCIATQPLRRLRPEQCGQVHGCPNSWRQELSQQPLTLLMDSRVKTSQADLAEQFRLSKQLYDEWLALSSISESVRFIRGQIAELRTPVPAGDLKTRIDALAEKLQTLTGAGGGGPGAGAGGARATVATTTGRLRNFSISWSTWTSPRRRRPRPRFPML